jgi:hypothetical protein
MRRHFLVSLCLAAAVAVAARAEPGSGARAGDSDPKSLIAAAAVRQAQLKRQFESCTQQLLILAGRLERGSPADREKARGLRAALRLVREKETAGKFDALIRRLKSKGAAGSFDTLSQIIKDNADLRGDLQRLIALLTHEDRDALRKEVAEQTARLLKRLNDVLAEQDRVHAATRAGRTGSGALAKDQGRVSAATQRLVAGKDAAADIVVRKQVQDAGKHQKQAEADLGRDRREDAAGSQATAIKELEKARKRLTDLLRQLREEESEAEAARKRHRLTLERRFQLARGKLLALAGRLEARGKPGDRARADLLRTAVAAAEKQRAEDRADALLLALAVPPARRPGLEKAFLALVDARSRIAALAADLERSLDVKALAARAEALADKVLPSVRQEVVRLSAAYEGILKEADVKAQERDLSPRVFATVGEPLRQVNEAAFARAEKALRALEKGLRERREPVAERVGAARKQALLARREVDGLVRQLGDVLAGHEGGGDTRGLVSRLAQILRTEEEQSATVERIRKKLIEELLKDD